LWNKKAAQGCYFVHFNIVQDQFRHWWNNTLCSSAYCHDHPLVSHHCLLISSVHKFINIQLNTGQHKMFTTLIQFWIQGKNKCYYPLSTPLSNKFLTKISAFAWWTAQRDNNPYRATDSVINITALSCMQLTFLLKHAFVLRLLMCRIPETIHITLNTFGNFYQQSLEIQSRRRNTEAFLWYSTIQFFKISLEMQALKLQTYHSSLFARTITNVMNTDFHCIQSTFVHARWLLIKANGN
jgi:hypothetical protein